MTDYMIPTPFLRRRDFGHNYGRGIEIEQLWTSQTIDLVQDPYRPDDLTWPKTINDYGETIAEWRNLPWFT